MSEAAPAAAESPIAEVAFAEAMRGFVIADGAHLAVAVSGGLDSMALLRLLQDWAAPRQVRLTALTVDHRLRTASTGEATQVGAWCAALRIPHVILTWTDGPAHLRAGRSPQADARAARYDLLLAWCRDHDVAGLCIAHHADDQVETFLMRLARGSGVDGLAAMAAETLRDGVRLLRPLLAIPKTALIATCDAHSQPWIADPSNENRGATRVRFRQARALLAAEGLDDTRLLETIGHMQRARTALLAAAQALLTTACQWEAWGGARLQLDGLFAAPEDVALRALADVLGTVGGAVYRPRFERLLRLYRALRQGPWADATLHGCVIVRDGPEIVIVREAAAVSDEQLVQPGGHCLWDRRFRVELSGAAPTPLRVRAAAAWATAERSPDVPRAARAALPMLVDDYGPVCLATPFVTLRSDAAESWKDKVMCRFDPPRAVTDLPPSPTG